MKSVRNAIQKKIDYVLILTGAFLLAYNIFDFSVKGGAPLRFLGEKSFVHAYAYYYQTNTKFNIALGMTLLIFGILIRMDYKRGGS